MARRKQRDPEEQQPAQQYDTTFKDWIQQTAPFVLPLLLPGAIYEATLNIEEELSMYSDLWENHPKVKKIRAETEIHALQRAIITVVRTRFPALTELAKQKVADMDNLDVLNYLLEEVSAATDEKTLRWVLRPLPLDIQFSTYLTV